MAVQRLTIELSELVLQYFTDMANLTNRSPEQLAAQSITGNLPPSFENAPADMHEELSAMQICDADELRQIAGSQMSAQQQQRLSELLERNQDGSIQPNEQQELKALRLTEDRLMFRTAYAWLVLRWRGQPVAALDKLPVGNLVKDFTCTSGTYLYRSPSPL